MADFNKIMTNYNQNANINPKSIMQYNKNVYAKQITLMNEIHGFNQHYFSMKPLKITFLNTIYLNDNTRFIQIKKIFNQYNQKVEKIIKQLPQSSTVNQQQHLKPNIMNAMLSVMRTVINCSNRKQQLSLLNQAYAWFIQKINTKQKYKKNHNYQLDLKWYLDQKIKRKENELKQKTRSTLPSEYTVEDMKDYTNEYRTLHTGIDTPQKRLLLVKRRIINSIKKQDKTDSINSARNNRFKYLKSVSKNKLKTQIQQLILQPYGASSDILKSQSSKIDTLNSPKPEVVLNSQQKLIQVQIQEQFDIEPEETKQIDKLAPKVKKYIDPFRIQDLKSQASIKKKLQIKQNQQIRNKIQQQTYFTHVKQWSKQKSRVKSQINRKLQSIRHTVSNKKIQRVQTQPIQKFINLGNVEDQPYDMYFQLEDKINRNNINSVKKFYGSKIVIQQEPQTFNLPVSLSIHQKVLKNYASERKPFSSILAEHSKSKQRQLSLRQVQQIKDRFVKYKINIPQSKIGQGILHPEQMSQSQLKQVGMKNANLLHNPYFKILKKKKKRKKKF